MGKFFLFTILIILFIAQRALSGDFKIVFEGEKQGLADETGKIVIPIIYENLGWSNGQIHLTGNVLGYFENGLWGMINVRNERITPPQYQHLYPGEGEFLIASRWNSFSEDLQFGVLDTSGKAKLGFQYGNLKMANGLLLAAQHSNRSMHWGVVDYQERVLIPIGYDSLKALHLNFVAYQGDSAALFNREGRKLTGFHYYKISQLGGYLLTHDRIGKQGLSNVLGNVLIAPQYKSVKLYNNDSVSVTEFPKWELIMPQSGMVRTFRYDSIKPVSKGIYKVTANGREAIVNIEETYILDGNNWKIATLDDQFTLVQKRGLYGVLKEDGIEVLPLEFDSIHYSGKHFYALKMNQNGSRWQIYSTFGSLISSSYFDQVHPMSENLIATSKNGYWGYIDFSGHTVIDYKYDRAWPFRDGRAKVDYLGKQGVINTAGNWVIYPSQTKVTIVNKNLFINHVDSRYDLLNGAGKIVYQTFNQLVPHSYGLLEQTGSNKFGLIDNSGHVLLKPTYDYISELSGGRVYILRKGEHYSIVNKQGFPVMNPINEFDSIGALSEGFLSIRKDGRYGFIDLQGNLRIANRYEAVKDFKEGMVAVKLVDRWGYVDRLERLLIQPLYDEVEGFKHGVSIVRKRNSFGIIDLEGNEVLPIEYDRVIRQANASFIIEKSGNFGLANSKGELLLPSKYEALEENRDGHLTVKKRGKYGVIQLNGINVIPAIYDRMIYDAINGYYLAGKPGKTIIQPADPF